MTSIRMFSPVLMHGMKLLGCIARRDGKNGEPRIDFCIGSTIVVEFT